MHFTNKSKLACSTLFLYLIQNFMSNFNKLFIQNLRLQSIRSSRLKGRKVPKRVVWTNIYRVRSKLNNLLSVGSRTSKLLPFDEGIFNTGKKLTSTFLVLRLPRWLRQQRICLQCWRPGFNPWVGKIPWRKEWVPTPVFLPENFMDRGAWWATVHGFARDWTQLSD